MQELVVTLTNKLIESPGDVMRFDERNEAAAKSEKEGLAVEFQ
ncbi:hypothetical protein C2W64_03710 [Brevibacillus laterosporus]|nr:hypothetical protein C2W64_03710 [Brevibacillus laterosporus]